jgi:hypothetical protein
MGLVLSLIVIAVGAILIWGVNADWRVTHVEEEEEVEPPPGAPPPPYRPFRPGISRPSVSAAMYPAIFGFSWSRRRE